MSDGIINPNAFGPRGRAHFLAAGNGALQGGVKIYQDAPPAARRSPDQTNTKAQADEREEKPQASRRQAGLGSGRWSATA